MSRSSIVTEPSAIAVAEPARIIRVGPASPPADSVSTSAAARRPPRSARPPEGSTGRETPKAAATTTAQCAPAFTASVSGDASGLRATDCSTAPAAPERHPHHDRSEQPRDSGGPQDVADVLVPRPGGQCPQVGGVDRGGPLGHVHGRERRRERSEQTQDQPRRRPGPGPPPGGGGPGRPGHGELAQLPRTSSSWSRKDSRDAGPPKVQVPFSSLCRRSARTKGIEVQILFFDNPSVNTSGSADEL